MYEGTIGQLISNYGTNQTTRSKGVIPMTPSIEIPLFSNSTENITGIFGEYEKRKKKQ